MKRREPYIPALNFDWLTPCYDFLVKLFMPEFRIKSHLIRQANIQPRQRILDVGCGTGTLILLIKQSCTDAEVIGLDGDTKILKIAQRKAIKAGVEIPLHKGLAFQLPYIDRSFDRVFSSLMFHHLIDENKRLALTEMCRVLEVNGEIHIADFKRPNKALPAMVEDLGLEQIQEYAEYRTLFGKVSLWSIKGRSDKHQIRTLPSVAI